MYIPNKNAYIFLKINKIDKVNNIFYLSPIEIFNTVAISFFNSIKDYSALQKNYTLLYKEKTNIDTNEKIVLFKHHNFSLDESNDNSKENNIKNATLNELNIFNSSSSEQTKRKITIEALGKANNKIIESIAFAEVLSPTSTIEIPSQNKTLSEAAITKEETTQKNTLTNRLTQSKEKAEEQNQQNKKQQNINNLEH